MKHCIIYINATGANLAAEISHQLPSSACLGWEEYKKTDLAQAESLIYVCALGICVREIAKIVRNKYVDPAIVCVDTLGNYAISVCSGHIGGANDLAKTVAKIIGAQPIITTQSDNAGTWALDTMGEKYGWTAEATKPQMNQAIFALVNGKKVALVLDIKDRGTSEMERTLPQNVALYKNFDDIPQDVELIIAVTPKIYSSETQILYYRPKVLRLGFGCKKNYEDDVLFEKISFTLIENGLSPLSVASIATITLKKDEKALGQLCEKFKASALIYKPQELKDIQVPNPSQKVFDTTGLWGVAESCALKSSDIGPMLIEKQKGEGYTFAVALDRAAFRKGHIEIVGAGPGDPELVSVRGKHFLEAADLILYAGSLVPEALTHYAKPGCVVRSSADMNLEEQFTLMKEFYDRDLLVVRLHTGDPCIYGAIQEQMAYFDQYGMDYHITPGISSFQAAAAELKSQFTIPEEVQSIILTRGEGRTPMPEREQLSKLAQSQSTMCIFLSAGIVDKVQEELLKAYAPDTPVAACYKLTRPEQRIYRGQLKDLARLVHDNGLTLTTLLVVGKAIDNRQGLSKLYDANFSHLYRP